MAATGITPGRYTTYAGNVGANSAIAPNATANHALLGSLFPADPTNYATMAAIQKAMSNDDESAVQKVIAANATAPVVNGVGGLVPSDNNQAGDSYWSVGPSGLVLKNGLVQFGFVNAPDVSKVVWKNPGDPMNPYMPDITSPGPGLTEGTDKNTAPPASVVTSTAALATTSDPGAEGTANPVTDSPEIYANNQIVPPGSAQQSPGESGAGVGFKP